LAPELVIPANFIKIVLKIVLEIVLEIILEIILDFPVKYLFERQFVNLFANEVRFYVSLTSHLQYHQHHRIALKAHIFSHFSPKVVT
jgi:hypothetical protein